MNYLGDLLFISSGNHKKNKDMNDLSNCKIENQIFLQKMLKQNEKNLKTMFEELKKDIHREKHGNHPANSTTTSECDTEEKLSENSESDDED